MLNRFKTALYNVVGSFDPGDGGPGGLGPGVASSLAGPPGIIRGGLLHGSSKDRSVRFPYTRPHFLQLGSDDEIQVTADHAIRPIICPRDITRLPWSTGYAETINAGKSKSNEDQAMVHVGLLTRSITLQPPSNTPQSTSNPRPNTTTSPTVPSETSLLVNGHVEEGSGDVLHTTTSLSSPQQSTATMSVSPATELKEDFCQSSNPSNHNNPSDASKQDPTLTLVQSSDQIDPMISIQPPPVTSQSSSLTEISLGAEVSTSDKSLETPTEESSTTIFLQPSTKQESSVSSQNPSTSDTSSQPTTTTSPITTDLQPTAVLLQPSSTYSTFQTTPPHSSATPQSQQGPLTTQPQAPTTKPFPVAHIPTSTQQTSIPQPSSTQPQSTTVSLPYYIFGVFDGHAGWGAAVAAANQLHHIIHEKLCDVLEILIPDPNEQCRMTGPLWPPEREVTVEAAVTGALENAFWQMDHMIGEDRLKYQLSGGCTACVGLFIHGHLYVANAGDSRGTLALADRPHPMSFDFTPETETQRIRKLGAMHPELLGGEFTHLDFVRRPVRRDLGKRVLYRDHYMTGWAYKTLTQDDLKYPLVCGEGKRSRVLATIGVTRGFGDHDLKAQCSSIPIKPFLTPEPEVRVYDLISADLCDRDVLVLATDGLWDITSNEQAVETVLRSLAHFPPLDQDKHKYRYTSAAQDLVMRSRGKLKERNWRTSDDKHATIDDISVFVVPLKPYRELHLEWMAKQVAGRNPESAGNDVCGIGVQENRVSQSSTYPSVSQTSTSPIPQNCHEESSELQPHEDYFKNEPTEVAQTRQQTQGHSYQSLAAT